MNYKYINYSEEERIVTITLNRPDKRNALNDRVINELDSAFSLAAADENCRVVVLNANGKVFSAGADLAYLRTLQQNTFEENLADSQALKTLLLNINIHPKITIAMVEGHAIAGGCGLATVCDFVWTVPEAKFGYTEAKIGFIPAIVMVFLLRRIGEKNARELLLTGKLISAEEALKVNLVNEIVDASEIQAAVLNFATKVADAVSPESVRRTKKLIGEVQSMSLTEALEHASQMNAHMRATEDCKRGIQAFLDKENFNW